MPLTPTRLLTRLARTGLRRGLGEGSRGWLYVGAAASALQVTRWLATRRPETVHVQELRAGQGIEIRVLPLQR
jgi:hypothetical protein